MTYLDSEQNLEDSFYGVKKKTFLFRPRMKKKYSEGKNKRKYHSILNQFRLQTGL